MNSGAAWSAPAAGLGPWLDTAIALVGAALLVAAFRLWRGRSELSARSALFHLAVVALLFGRPLATRELELPSTIEYRLTPWREELVAAPSPVQAGLSDVPELLLPLRSLVNRRLLAGELPLWSHELGVGQPLLANAQSAAFSPFHLLAIALPPARGMTVAAALGALLALLGTHALARRLGAGEAGARLAALAFALSGFGIAWRYYPIGLAAAHLPALALGLVGLLRNERRDLLPTAAILASALLAGNPEPLALAAVPAAAAIAWQLRLAPGRRFAIAGRLALAATLALAFAAPAWLPLATAIPESARAQELVERPDLMSPPAASWRHLATIWQPFAAGSPWNEAAWSGQANWSELASIYCGLVPLALALVGWLRGFAPRPLALLAALSLAGAFPFGGLWTRIASLPGLHLLPISRARVLFVLAVALAAGLALDRLASEARRSRRGLVAVALALALLSVASALHAPRPLERAQLAAAVVALALLATTIALGRARAFAVVAVAGVATELVLLAWSVQVVVPETMDFRPPPAVRALVEAAANPAGEPVRVAALPGRFIPYLPALYGLWDPRGYDAMRPADSLRLLRARLDRSEPGRLLQLAAPPDPHALAFLGVRLLLTGPGYALPSPWEKFRQEETLALWRDPGPRPIFFSPERIVAAGSQRSALALAAWELDLEREVSVERWELARPPLGRAIVRSIRAVNNGFELDVDAPAGAIVASSVAASRGWRASAPEGDVRVVRVDGAFLGIELAPGVRRVALRYSPPGWNAAKVLFLVGALGFAAVLFLQLRHPGRDAPAAWR